MNLSTKEEGEQHFRSFRSSKHTAAFSNAAFEWFHLNALLVL